MSYTKQKLSEMKNFLAATLEAENENYKNLCDSLESNLYTLDNNLGEIDTSIDLINGNDMPMSQPAMAPQPEYAPAPAAAYEDEDDDDYDDYDDEDEDDDDFDDDDYDDEDDDDDFLDE